MVLHMNALFSVFAKEYNNCSYCPLFNEVPMYLLGHAFYIIIMHLLVRGCVQIGASLFCFKFLLHE